MISTNSIGQDDSPATDSRAGVAEPYAWDWSATTHQGYEGVVDDLLAGLGAETVEIGKGLQGWSQSVAAFDAAGFKSGTVYFGGGRDDVHVVSTSHQAHDARLAVIEVGEARTSRVDTRVDTLLPFDQLRSLCEDVAGPQTKVTYMESFVGGTSAGRTLYVGAPSSMVRVRVYEKWLESPGLYVEGCNRVEVQLRPPSRGKEKVSAWGPGETFCASKLTRRLATALEANVEHPATLQKSKGTPDLERTLQAMGAQYGNAVGKWVAARPGGEGWATVLDYLDGSKQPEQPPTIRPTVKA